MGTKRRRRTVNPSLNKTDSTSLVTEEQPLPEWTDEQPQEEFDSALNNVDITDFALPAIDSDDPLRELCNRLKERRQTLGLSIADVARQLHSSSRSISELEEGPLDTMDAPFYIKNRLRLYVQALRVDPDLITEFYESVLASKNQTITMSHNKVEMKQWLPYAIAGGVGLLVLLLIIWNL